MRPLAAVVLAAGKGTRMGGDIPKVCHELDGKPLIAHVLEAIAPLQPERIILIVGYRAEAVAGAVRAFSKLPVEYVRQEEQRGTGHAVSVAEPPLKNFDGDILIRYGDTPLCIVEEGQVFTLEFGAMTDAGFVGLEEDVIVTANGCEFLEEPQGKILCV